jgi:hypothetical protein
MSRIHVSCAPVAWFFVVLLCPLLSPTSAPAQPDFVPVYRPQLDVSRALGPIKVDAYLDDAGWKDAAMASNFAEHDPGDQTRPAVDTQVLVAFDDNSLYVAWICHDDPREVRASFCERDRIFSDDYVILCLDTYGESALAYEIAANPYGIPGDLLFSAASGEDITYDMIFESAGRLTEFGWVVEMAIPFSSIRFPRSNEQVWRVDFWRNRPRESRYKYSWAAYDRDNACWPCQWGSVSGVSGVESGAGLELLPSVIAFQSGALGTDGDFINENVDGELTAEATINPDFSQVESDVAQIDVNSTFALFYSEKRPFFQEGSDLFDTYFESVYTRSINDPIVAGKMTLRKGRTSVAFLSAADDRSVITLPFEEQSAFVENGRSFSNILRARRDFGDQSHIGVVATDRRFRDGGSGSLMGADGQVRFSQSNAVRFQVQATYTREVDNLALADSAFNAQRFDDGKYTAGLDGESFSGHSAYVGLSRETSSYWASLEYAERAPTFRADNGFEPSNNSRTPSAYLGGVVRFENSKILEQINGNVNAARKWNFEGVKKDEWIVSALEVRFRAAQTGIHSQYMASNELFGGVQFDDIRQAHTCFSTQPTGALSFGGNINYGHRIARRFLVMGKEITYGLWTDLKPIDRFLIGINWSGERLFSQQVFRTRFSFQILRALSARLILQYQDRSERDGFHGDRWEVDPLITYQINPLTIFYVGSTRDYTNLEPEEHRDGGWELSDRQYFLKLQYLFQL